MLVTKPAPDFSACAVMPDGSFNEAFQLSSLKGKYVVLFFYPLDFTFVCPTELIAFDARIKEFESRDTQIVGVSIDSQFSHAAWKATDVNNGGIGPVKYPLVADVKHEITKAYDIEHDAGVALRGSFLIDKEGIIRHAVINDLPLGRNIDEMLRVIDALQFFEKHGEVCPAGWNKGDAGMKADAEGVASYLSENADKL